MFACLCMHAQCVYTEMHTCQCMWSIQYCLFVSRFMCTKCTYTKIMLACITRSLINKHSLIQYICTLLHTYRCMRGSVRYRCTYNIITKRSHS